MATELPWYFSNSEWDFTSEPMSENFSTEERYSWGIWLSTSAGSPITQSSALSTQSYFSGSGSSGSGVGSGAGFSYFVIFVLRFLYDGARGRHHDIEQVLR